MRKLLLILYLLFFANMLFGQPKYGLPIAKTYTPEEYNGSTQIWAFAQKKNGLLYAGNRFSLLEYDGVSWSKVNNSQGVVRSLIVSPDDTLFIGKSGDFGYLGYDSLGSPIFVSLLHLVPEEERNFKDIWEIGISKNTIFFQSKKVIFKYENGSIQTIKPSVASFNRMFNSGGKCFVFQFFISDKVEKDIGMYCYDDQKGEFIQTNYTLPNRVCGIVKLPSNEFVFGATYKGLIKYDFNKDEYEIIQKFQTEELMNVFQNWLPYSLIFIDEHTLSIGTLKGGITLLDINTGVTTNLRKENSKHPQNWELKKQRITC